jgi:phenylalanyl-tRNA synthetase alpha chain
VTLPGRQRGMGGCTRSAARIERIEAIFGSMGFDVAEGPEIETDWMSFTALNNPENHPARSMQDTFYVDMKDAEAAGSTCARTPARCRCAMPAHAAKYAGVDPMPEIRVIAPGRTYRVDSDATHSPMFHQCEGLWMGENVSFKDLKVGVHRLLRQFFETDDFDCASAQLLPVHRARPRSTSPSQRPAGRPLAGSGGLGPGAPERGAQLRAGPRAPHRLCLRHGPDRLAMLRYGVNDLRLFFDGDLRFLSQFR